MSNYRNKLSFLENLLGSANFSSGTNEALFSCPFCKHHKKKLSINLELDLWQCWPCGKAGKNLGFLIRKVGSSRDVDLYVQKYKSKHSNFVANKQEGEVYRPSLPEEFVPLIHCKDSFMGKKIYSWLTGIRKVEEEDILRHKIGTAMSGRLQGTVIMPSFDSKGLLNLYTSRFLDGGIRKYHTPSFPKGYKNSIILNELNIDWEQPVVIVEAFLDMMKSVPNTVPLFGSSLKEESLLFQTIVRNNSSVFLALDADAKSKSNKIAEEFMKWDISVYNVDIVPYGDVGEMSKKEFTKRYECAELVSHQSVFRDKLRNLC